MSQIPPLIISASAGTGKTYRLALEYVRLLLRYYGKKDFRVDNILVLTFTRKATAEIRERIQQHLKTICSADPRLQPDRESLIASLLGDADASTFGIREQNLLQSALRDISNDRKMLQVMTLDSYINAIFRNIVRPLRSLDEFDVDVLAIEKRMPFLLGHLMTPALKKRVDSLLRRRVSASLDRYRSFFSSLIENRWLYYLIKERLAPAEKNSLLYHYKNRDTSTARQELDRFFTAMETLLGCVGAVQLKNARPLEDYFNSAFKKLFRPFPDSEPGILQQLHQYCGNPREARRVLAAFSSGNLYSGTYIRKPVPELLSAQSDARRHLANYLIHTLFLEEQEEIESVWEAILTEYDQLIYRYRNMTYDDIAWFSLEAISNPDITHMDGSIGNVETDIQDSLSHRSRFILIDEFQDTSLLQFAILRPIILEISAGEGSKPFGGLIVVGDEKQSIFGWRGGERELILHLQEIFPTLGEVVTEDLRKSWRSTPALVGFVNAIFADHALQNHLITNAMNWSYTTIESTREADNHLSCLSFQCLPYKAGNGEDGLDQLLRNWVRAEIEPFAKPSRGESVAVLCRDNNQLGNLQMILDEFGIPSIYQPNSLLVDHPKVKPLVVWLRWLAYRQWTDWLEFLRSDYVMLKTAPLKTVLRAVKACESQSGCADPDFGAVPLAFDLYQLSATMPTELSAICDILLDRFLPGLDLSERDMQNLTAFMNVLRGFEASASEPEKDIPAFLRYLDDNRKQDELKQVAVEGNESLQLLTIHKSKGLQFERVFVIYNLSAGHGGTRDVLNWFTSFADKTFSHLRDYALTYHYTDILKYSDFSRLHVESQNREMLEELNNLYVALTRAKTKLHMLFTYQGSSDWDGYLQYQKSKNSLKLPMLLCDACVRYFAPTMEAEVVEQNAIPDKPTENDRCMAEAEEDKEKTPPPRIWRPESLARVLPVYQPAPPSEPREKEYANLRKIWLEDRHNLFGDLVHHYLSHLIHSTDSEHAHAARACIARFCSILPQSSILAVEERIRTIIPSLGDIFDCHWDKVFTEFPIYHRGKEMRIDRLMLDTKTRQGLIVDYKTGGIHEKDQLDRYLAALMELPAIRDGSYKISTRYLPIKILE